MNKTARLANFVVSLQRMKAGYPFEHYAEESEWVRNNLPSTRAAFAKVKDALGKLAVSDVDVAAYLLNTSSYAGKLGTHTGKGNPVNPIWKTWLKPKKDSAQRPACSVCGAPAVGMSNFGGWRCANHYDDAS